MAISAATAAVTIPVPELVEMLEAGVHFGHERSKKNPKMEPYVFLQRNRVAIIDLEKTQEGLKRAAQFVYSLAGTPTKEILFVGTKRQARDIVRRYAESVNMPYVTKRWLGGTLTNFSTILKSIEKLAELKGLEGTDSAEKLTKKERSVMRKEIDRLEAVLEGIMNVRTLPAALFVVGTHDEKLAVREARRMGIPVIGITDTNADPDLVDYAIPGNDDAVRALDLLVGTITKAIQLARSTQVSAVPDEEKA
jgi:small subunit ribosomal protein S2